MRQGRRELGKLERKGTYNKERIFKKERKKKYFMSVHH